MLSTIFPLAFIICITLADPEADSADALLRSEIESAASESRALADELADMLGRLEAEEDREDAVEAAVIGDGEKVENALKEMIEKIQELADASEDSNTKELTGSVEQKRKEEEELRSTVDKLELVAKKIEEVSSVKDVKTIDDMAELLQSVSDKIEGKIKEGTDEVDKELIDGKEASSTALELNGIDEMIRSLEKVTDDLRGLHENVDVNYDYEESESLNDSSAKVSKSIDSEQRLNISDYDNDNSEDVEHTETNNTKNVKDRNPKSLSLNSETDKETEPSYVSNSKKEESDNTDKKEREPKELKDDEPIEECTEKEATNRVKVCLPKFSTVDNTVQLYSGEVKEERHCYDVTKTICQESSQIVSKEVCVYSYNQKTVVVPAQMTEVTFERRQEKLAVTKCAREIHTGYKKDVEVCKQDYKEIPYRLPALIDNVDDFLELSIPEPDMRCQVYRYEIPEVSCKDVTTRECSELAHVDPVAVTEYLDTVQPDYKGKCGQRVLKQDQQVCTLDQKVKRPKPSYQG